MIKLAIIGDPIEHSLSPLVHGGVMEVLGVPYAFEKVRVKQGELEKFLDYAKKEEITGFNLTMPHKMDVIPFLDEIDEEASLFGAVNTVKIENGKFLGFNTDALGYTMALESMGYSFQGSRVVILGAGGVVRTLALKAANCGAKEIHICNRTKDKAGEIALSVNQKTGVPVFAEEFSVDAIAKVGKTCDIFINGTPLGMHGVDQEFEDLSFLESLPKTALISDLIYNPSKTKLLGLAEKKGYPVLNGLGMLIYQGILADEIFLGKTLDKNKVYQKICQRMVEKCGF